jgi:hypothetical protein
MARSDAESLHTLLGGRSSALDAALPAVAFVIGWMLVARLAPDAAIGSGATAAIAAGVAVAGWRLKQGRQPVATVVSLLAVCLAAIIVLRTGRAEDFFVVRILTNAASALAWAGSIMVRWPLLGVVVGGLLGQKARWRRDPALLGGYGRASWIWFGQYVVRLAVLGPLWLAGQTVLLATAQVLVTWPLVAACIAASWWVLRRSLPPDHPGLRHPVVPGEPSPGPPPPQLPRVEPSASRPPVSGER